MTKSICLKQWEVKAALDGNLKQVRRVVKPQWGNWTFATILLDGRAVFDESNGYDVHYVTLPYSIGNVIAVKETWRVVGWGEDTPFTVQFKFDSIYKEQSFDDWLNYDPQKHENLWIESSDDCIKAGLEPNIDDIFELDDVDPPTRWRSPVTMPQWAVRLHLVVTGVRCERIQNVKYDDLAAMDIPFNVHDVVIEYQNRWDADNPKHLWKDNPWVWVYDVEVKE